MGVDLHGPVPEIGVGSEARMVCQAHVLELLDERAGHTGLGLFVPAPWHSGSYKAPAIQGPRGQGETGLQCDGRWTLGRLVLQKETWAQLCGVHLHRFCTIVPNPLPVLATPRPRSSTGIAEPEK